VASGSSHDSINRMPEDDESAYASIVNFAELYENGYTVSASRNDETWFLEESSVLVLICVNFSSEDRMRIQSETRDETK